MCSTMLRLLPFLLLIGCTPRDAWRSKHGIHVWEEGLPYYFTPEQLEVQTQHVIDGLVELYPRSWVERSVGAAWLYVSPDPVECPGYPEGCNGTVIAPTVQVRAMPCVWNTAFNHELLHFLLFWITGDYDGNHTRPEVWQIAAGTQGVCE